MAHKKIFLASLVASVFCFAGFIFAEDKNSSAEQSKGAPAESGNASASGDSAEKIKSAGERIDDFLAEHAKLMAPKNGKFAHISVWSREKNSIPIFPFRIRLSNFQTDAAFC